MNSCRQHIAVALFVRHPVPGRVKTRLACDLGEEGACELYLAMVADVISNIKACGLPIYLFHDGQYSVDLPMLWVDAAEALISQSGGLLGERMAAAYQYLFSIGQEQVVLVGSDIPGIDVLLLQSAMAELEAHDFVFSPAFDGGYCLVASKKHSYSDSVFLDIPWSTSLVLETTLAKCKATGISYALLEPRQDIDTLNDVKTYCSQPANVAPSTNAWLVSHRYLVSPN